MFLVCVFSFASTLHYCVCGLTKKIILCFTTKDRAFELIRLYSEDKPMPIVYKYVTYVGVHVVTLWPHKAPLLLFYDPEKISDASPQDLCLTGRLGGMEANVMAGRALFCVFRPRTALRHVHPPREDNARQE
jgi:hypothetical protein